MGVLCVRAEFRHKNFTFLGNRIERKFFSFGHAKAAVYVSLEQPAMFRKR